MMERALGNESKWSGYFASLPDREYLPIFWDDDLKGLLIGTEIEASVAEDEALMAADYAQNIVPLLDRLGALSSRCQLDDFCKAASLVASRAFGIDDYHGDAMVPVADIFNHKASVVELAPEYEVVGASSSDDEVEEGGEGVLPPNEEEDEDASSDEEDGSGSSGESSGDEQSSKAGDSGTDESDHESLTEHESLTSHPASGPERRMVTDPAAPLPSVLGRSEVNGLHLRLEIGIVDGEANEEEVDIIAASKVAQGREVHNTYGELGNAELVAKYGFALVENPFTTVKLCKSFLLQCSKLPSQLRSQRCTFLKEHTDLLDQEEEPICVLPRGHVNAGLWAVLLTLSAPQAEFQSWKGIEDALRAGGGDSAPKNQPTICHEECTAEHSHVHAAPDVVVDEFGSIVLRDVLSVLEASWQQSLAAILREAVQHRAGKYGAMLEEDRAALSACEEAFARRDGAAPLSEREAAMLAARRLRVDEQLILHECLEALGS